MHGLLQPLLHVFPQIAILQTVEKQAHLGKHHSETGYSTIFKVHYEIYCFQFCHCTLSDRSWCDSPNTYVMLVKGPNWSRPTTRGFYSRLLVGIFASRRNTIVPLYESYYRRMVECRIHLRLTVQAYEWSISRRPH